MHHNFSFDGFGINGKDAHRSRLATLTGAGMAAGVGPLFAASDKLLAACKAIVEADDMDPRTWPALCGASIAYADAFALARVAIAEAEPDGMEAAYQTEPVFAPDEKHGAD